MSAFKKGQIVFIRYAPENHLRGARGKVVLIYRKRFGPKRRPIYKEYVYLDTTWRGLDYRTGGKYIREIVLPVENLIAIPEGYEPITSSKRLRSDDMYLDGSQLTALGVWSSAIHSLAGSKADLFVREIGKPRAAAKKAVRKKAK